LYSPPPSLSTTPRTFSGAPLPAKIETDISRREERARNFAKAVQMEKDKAPALDVKKMYARSVAITPEMRKQLLDRCTGEYPLPLICFNLFVCLF
jgi:hypothetical protein